MPKQASSLAPLWLIAGSCLVLAFGRLWLREPPPAPPAGFPPPPVVVTPQAPAPPPAPPPLQEVQLKEVPIHAIPEEGGGRPGHPLDLSHEPPERHVSSEVANGASRAPLPGAPAQFAGTAKVTAATALEVGVVPVQLYAVKPAGSGDRCGTGPAADCAAAARTALAARLAGSLSCHVPSPHPGIVVAFAICLDAQGTDLGGLLVGQGLALADTGISYDYVSLERQAREARRGLWQFR
jgi:endonuclease YncB( thermonuclease family)